MDENLLLTEENEWTLDTDNEQQNWQTANPLISSHNDYSLYGQHRQRLMP